MFLNLLAIEETFCGLWEGGRSATGLIVDDTDALSDIVDSRVAISRYSIQSVDESAQFQSFLSIWSIEIEIGRHLQFQALDGEWRKFLVYLQQLSEVAGDDLSVDELESVVSRMVTILLHLEEFFTEGLIHQSVEQCLILDGIGDVTLHDDDRVYELLLTLLVGSDVGWTGKLKIEELGGSMEDVTKDTIVYLILYLV